MVTYNQQPNFTPFNTSCYLQIAKHNIRSKQQIIRLVELASLVTADVDLMYNIAIYTPSEVSMASNS